MINDSGLSDRNLLCAVVVIDDAWRHLPVGGWSVAGTLAELHHLRGADFPVRKRPFQGVDMAVLNGVHGLDAGYRDDFYLWHRHTDGHAILVHKRTGLELRIFPAHPDTPVESLDIAHGYRAPMQTMPPLIVKLLEEVLRLEDHLPVDPKLFDYLNDLMDLLRGQTDVRADTRDFWRSLHPDSHFSIRLDDAYALRSEREQLLRSPRRSWRRCPDCTPGGGRRLTSPLVIAFVKSTRRWRTPGHLPAPRV